MQSDRGRHISEGLLRHWATVPADVREERGRRVGESRRKAAVQRRGQRLAQDFTKLISAAPAMSDAQRVELAALILTWEACE